MTGRLDHKNTLLHQQQDKVEPDKPVHKVVIKEGTKLYEILQDKYIYTNSFHNQAIQVAGLPAIASAHSEDGVIEAIESKSHSFVFGFQFHPEKMPNSDYSQKILQAFLHAANCYKEKA